jgi:hypothetical protein
MTNPTPSPAQTAWDSCYDWSPMLIALATPGTADRRTLARALADCLRTVLMFVPPHETRPRAAVDLATRWADGYDVAPKDLRAAARGARDAVWAADALGAAPGVTAADYTAAAAATLAELTCTRRRLVGPRAIGLLTDVVAAQTEAACTGLPSGARADMTARMANAMAGVLATILRMHFPRPPAAWAS